MNIDNPGPRLVYSRSRVTHRHADLRAVNTMQALGENSRLAIFRLLMRAEPDGLAVGIIAERLRSPQNTISAHLAVLSRAQLVSNVRQSRTVVYRVNLGGLYWLVAHILADCCHGDSVKCETVEALLRELPGQPEALVRRLRIK